MGQTQKKLLIKCSNKFKKPYFWSIFGPFSLFFGQKFFFKKLPHKPLTPRCVSEKTNEAIPRNLPDGMTIAQKDRRT